MKISGAQAGRQLTQAGSTLMHGGAPCCQHSNTPKGIRARSRSSCSQQPFLSQRAPAWALQSTTPKHTSVHHKTSDPAIFYHRSSSESQARWGGINQEQAGARREGQELEGSSLEQEEQTNKQSKGKIHYICWSRQPQDIKQQIPTATTSTHQEVEPLSLLVKAWPKMHMWSGYGFFPQICIEMLCLIIIGFKKSKLASVLIH